MYAEVLLYIEYTVPSLVLVAQVVFILECG